MVKKCYVFVIFFSEWSLEGGFPPPQMTVIKFKIKEMHFKNVDHYCARALNKKILNTFTLLKDCTSIHRQCLQGTTFATRQHSSDCADAKIRRSSTAFS